MKFLTLLIGVSLILFSCQSDKNSESIFITLESEKQSLEEIKTMKEFVNTIKVNSTWFYLLIEKAKAQNISVKEILKSDAEYMVFING